MAGKERRRRGRGSGVSQVGARWQITGGLIDGMMSVAGHPLRVRCRGRQPVQFRRPHGGSATLECVVHHFQCELLCTIAASETSVMTPRNPAAGPPADIVDSRIKSSEDARSLLHRGPRPQRGSKTVCSVGRLNALSVCRSVGSSAAERSGQSRQLLRPTMLHAAEG